MVSTEVRGLANPNPGEHGATSNLGDCMHRAAECPQGLVIWAPNINIFRGPRWLGPRTRNSRRTKTQH
jgi:hypothetical protein